MKKRDPLMDYIVALLVRGDGPVVLSRQELLKARRKNFSITLSRETVKLALLGELPSIMPYERKGDT